MEVFTQFSSDLDDSTKEQLQYGSGLMELLKQPLCNPLSLHDKVITLVVATHKLLLDVAKTDIKKCQGEMLDYFNMHHSEIGNEIEEKRDLDDELIGKIISAT